MNFKDQLKKDLDIFLNQAEFADTHNIDGMDLTCLVDESSMNERTRQPADRYLAADGVFQSTKVLYVNAEEYERPVVGARISFDGEYYYVTAAAIEDGLLRVEISANEV